MRRTRRGRLHPVAIALIAIALIAAVTYYAFSQSIPFAQPFTLHALVDNSVAVRTDSPVRIAGVEVGRVEGTRPAGRSTTIDFVLDANGQPIHTDATIRIRSRLFLEGGYYLELNPGSPSAPTAASGFTIPERDTVTPVQFYNVLSTFDAAARASLERQLYELTDGFGLRDSRGRTVSAPGAAGFKRAVPALTPVLRDTALINRALIGRRPGDLRSLIESSARVADTLAGRSAELTGLVSGLARTSSALASADGALGASIAGFDGLLKSAPPALSALDAALPPATALARTLDPSLRVAPELTERLAATVRRLSAVVAGPSRVPLLRALRTTFVAFPTGVSRIASLFPQTRSATDCLSRRIVPVLQSTVPDGALTSGDPVWKEFVHFLPRIAGASANFDANGHWVRYLAGAGTTTINLGTLPLLGSLLSTGPATPSGQSSTLQGASPHWVGDLTSAAFHPEIECGTQGLPGLAAVRTASDQRGVSHAGAPAPAARRAVARALRRAVARGGAGHRGGAR